MKRPARDLVREATMRRQYEGGLTLRQVGEQHDLTYERVRQILRRAKVPMRSRGRQTPPVFGPAPKEGEGDSLAGHLGSPSHRPINQLPPQPAEHEHIAAQPNDHGDVRRGIPD